MPKLKLKKSGFTMIELLVVIAIMSILIITFFFFMRSSLNRAQDARTKDYLFELKTAFEDYYNDNYCYPPEEWFDSVDDCETNQLAPYLNKIKCDQFTGLPYHLEYDTTGCDSFKIYGNLYFPDEELCTKYGTGLGDYNFGVSSTNTQVSLNCDAPLGPASPSPSPSSSPGASPSPSPTPSPSPSPEGDYYCQAIGNCTWYNNTAWTCTPNYEVADCEGECAFRTGACTLD